MAEPLAHPGGAPLRSRGEALPHAGLIHFSLLDKQAIDVDALSILSVGDRSPYRLGDDAGGALGNKLENIERLLDAFAADLIHHQAYFSRRDSDKSCDRTCFHIQARLLIPIFGNGKKLFISIREALQEPLAALRLEPRAEHPSSL